jgi:nucleotide-binding universal stress UspA family protein
MSIKTILVHLESEKHAGGITKAAIAIAKSFSAHLVGLHVVPDAFISAAVPPEVVGELLEAQRQANQAVGKRIAEAFDKTVAGAGISFEWRTVEAHLETTAMVVMRYGRAAELVILGQPDTTINLIDGMGATEEIMLGLGRPVLLVPHKATPATIGTRILLAWNGSAEAARAAFDAMPFLEAAKSVRLMAAGQAAGTLWGTLADDVAPTTGIEAALARHGIGCSVETVVAARNEVAGALLQQAKEHACDLIVMGGYGHWRLREIVFGGATRGVLEQATIPVLMSH